MALELLAAFTGGLCFGTVLGMIAMHVWVGSVGRKAQRDIDRARRLLNRMDGPEWR